MYNRFALTFAAIALLTSGSTSARGDQLPDLAPMPLRVPTVVTGPPNPVITLEWGVTNRGGSVTDPNTYWWDTWYLSTNAVLDETATLMQSLPHWSPLSAASGYDAATPVMFPVKESGRYSLFLQVNNWNLLAESDPSNNAVQVPIDVVILPPDLRPLSLLATAEFSGPPLPYVTISWGVTNQGQGLADGYWHLWADALYLSTNSVRDGNEQPIGSFLMTNQVAPGGCYWTTNRVRLPVSQSGSYYLFLQVAPYNEILESDTNNNSLCLPLKFTATPPDLTPVAFEVPNVITGQPNPRINLVWGVTNQGSGPAIGQIGTVLGVFDGWLDSFYISTNAILDGTATRIDSWEETNALPAGLSYFRTNAFSLPVLTSGDYYIFLVTDDFNGLLESNFTNNVVARRITITVRPPDLAAMPLNVPAIISGPPQSPVQVVIGVTNCGVGEAVGQWADRLQLCTGPSLPSMPGCDEIGYWYRTTGLGPGETYWLTNTLTIPAGGGQYTLVFTTDAWNNLFETDETNNLAKADLLFLMPLSLSNGAILPDGSFSVDAYATLGLRYALQASTNLLDWSEVTSFDCMAWPFHLSDASAHSQTRRFYRLQAK